MRSYITHSLITISAARKMGGQKLMVRLSLVMEKRRPRSSDKSSTASSLPTLSKAPEKEKLSAVLSREKNFSYWKFEAPYQWHLVSVGTIEELIGKVSQGAFSHLREEAVEKRFFSTKYSLKQKTGDVYEIHQIIETLNLKKKLIQKKGTISCNKKLSRKQIFLGPDRLPVSRMSKTGQKIHGISFVTRSPLPGRHSENHRRHATVWFSPAPSLNTNCPPSRAYPE